MVTIILNGEPKEIEAATVLDLVEFLDLPVSKLAVERNFEIVPRSLYGQTHLLADDKIEIVHFVGGG